MRAAVLIAALLLTSCAVTPCLERCAETPRTFGACWCVQEMTVGGR